MTTHPTSMDAGSVDSVAESLLLTEEDNAPEAEAAAEDEAPELDARPEETAEDQADDATDEAADEDDGVEEPQTQTFTVKVDGQEVAVTLDDLKRAYAGQGYIQKRMQEVAAVRKEAEQTYHALNAERQQLMQALQAYEQQLASSMNPQPPSQELLKTDPIAYLEQDAAYRQAVETRQAVRQQYVQLAQQQQAQQEQAYRAYLAEQAQVLQQRIPDFADAKKAKALQQSLVETATTAYGYSADELRGLSDARAVQVLHDAMRYRQLMAGREAATKKVEKPTAPVVRPGARRSDATSAAKQEQQARSRMKRTGSVDDVASFLITR